MIDFTKETYMNILTDMLAQVPNTLDKREGGMIQTALGPAAYALEEYYLALDQVQKAAYVQTAVGDSLDYLAVIAGLSRYPASAAVRLGVFNQEVPLGARFSTINGSDSINFVVTAETETANQYQLTAETEGVIGNSYTGAILPITYLPSLTEAQLTDILIPGEDKETDEQLRQRLIIALNERAFGGNVAAYRSEISAIEGVGAVRVYPTWNGGGTVKCSILGADYMPASEELLTLVQNAIDPKPNQGLGLGMAPIGAKVTIATPETVSISVSAAVTLASGYDMGQVQPLIEEAVEAYLLEIRQKWASPTIQGGVEYTANVYRAQIIAAIVGVTGVLNAVNVTLNGQTEDVLLTETGSLQQVPVKGTVTLSVAV